MLKRVVAFVGVLFFVSVLPASAVDLTTWRYDTTRTGQDIAETQLVPAKVNPTDFGKLFTYAVDGFVYAQPLYVSAQIVAGVSHNVLFVATQHDSVFAFDADKNQQLWKASLLDTAHGAAAGATTVPSADLGSNDIVPEIGITGTPVIDSVAKTLYVVAKSKENGVYVNRLHALDLLTGNERTGSPVVIAGSVPGDGTGNVNGTIAFLPQWELNRTGLALFDGHVYVAFAAHGDNGPYHGWIFAYEASSLKVTAIFNASPDARGNGIWQSGAALAAETVDGVPQLYFATGNVISAGGLGPNPVPPYTSTQNYSNAIVRMDISNGGLKVSDEWTPFDQQHLSDADTDQTSGGIILLPDQTGATPHELVQVGKNGRIEVLDRDNLGGYNTTYNNIAQEISGEINGLWSTPAYWNGNLYFWGNGDHLKQFTLQAGRLSTAPSVVGTISSAFPGASPVVTSNGTTGGIVWALRTDAYASGGPAILYAFDATKISTQLYSSDTQPARDSAGKAVKFQLPSVVNGKVYVGAQGEVDVFGLLAANASPVPAPTFTPTPGVYGTAQSVSIADSLGGTTIYYTLDGSTPTTGSTRYSGPFTIGVTTTVQAIGVAAGYNNSNVVTAAYTIGSAAALNFSNGFASVKGLTLNGSAINTDDSRLQLTAGAKDSAGSAFSSAPVNVQSFVSDFTFQLSGPAPLADGITFTLQATGPTALGSDGGGLGYGLLTQGGASIKRSVAVKFDVYSNTGEGTDSTGIYLNGVSPTIPAIDLTPSRVVLSSGDIITAHIVYDGTYLYLTLTDAVNGGVYVGRFAVDIPKIIGSTMAYVGFTGGTGGLIASQKILTWTFTPQPQLTAIVYDTVALPAKSSGPTFRTAAWAGYPSGIGTILDSTKVGDSVTFTVNFGKAGTYDLNAISKAYYLRGMFQLSVDGVNVGLPQDEYSATEKLVNYDVGPLVIATAGNHLFKFSVVGDNPASLGSNLGFGTLKFLGR